MRYSGVSVPPLYEENFRRAIWAFQHQRVYDPTKQNIVHLLDVPHGCDEDLEFLGPYPLFEFCYNIYVIFCYTGILFPSTNNNPYAYSTLNLIDLTLFYRIVLQFLNPSYVVRAEYCQRYSRRET